MVEQPEGMQVRNALRELNPAKVSVEWQGDTLAFVGCYFSGAVAVYRFVGEGKEVHYNPQNEVFRAVRHRDGEQFTLSPQSVDDDTIHLSER